MIDISLKEFGIEPNGVIHIGARTGEMAPYYHKEGLHKVLWIEKDHANARALYHNTIQLGMSQLYYVREVAGYTDLDTKTTFKDLWRVYNVDIDIETYDMLNLDIRSDHSSIIEGFGEFMQFMHCVVLRNNSSAYNAQNKLNDLGFNLTIETSNILVFQRQ